MIKFQRHYDALTEAFDKPYRFRRVELYDGYCVYRFKTTDKSEVEVFFREIEISDDESYWTVNFERNMSTAVTGEGDAMRIFATVIEVIKDFTKKEKPQELAFSAEKPAERLTLPKDHPERSKEMGSREKLYKKLIQRYAGRMGYKFSARSDYSATDFRLVRK